MKIKFTILVLLIILCLKGFSQTESTVDSLQTQYQNCLDKGTHMLYCSQHFYYKMDSLLNVVYIKLRSKLNDSEKLKLKNDQKLWLITRDIYFKNTYKKYKPQNFDEIKFWGQDDEMFMYDDNAKFVMERVLVLLKKLNH